MIVFECFIPGDVPSSKNSRMWTGRYSIASKSTRKWRENTSHHWKKFQKAFLNATKNLPKPLQIEFEFVRKTKHKFDYVNKAQGPLDEMVKHGWIPDDNADEVVPSFSGYSHNSKRPGFYLRVIYEPK
jgi:hypothetical protein